MSKPSTYPTDPSPEPNNDEEFRYDILQEPLSGSKKVKNHKHSRDRHGEGS